MIDNLAVNYITVLIVILSILLVITWMGVII